MCRTHLKALSVCPQKGHFSVGWPGWPGTGHGVVLSPSLWGRRGLATGQVSTTLEGTDGLTACSTILLNFLPSCGCIIISWASEVTGPRVRLVRSCDNPGRRAGHSQLLRSSSSSDGSSLNSIPPHSSSSLSS